MSDKWPDSTASLQPAFVGSDILVGADVGGRVEKITPFFMNSDNKNEHPIAQKVSLDHVQWDFFGIDLTHCDLILFYCIQFVVN